MSELTIDFYIMRENCIQIHQEVHELFLVSNHIGEELNLVVNSADELMTHELTSSWDGMGRFAKELHDNSEFWDKLPKEIHIISNSESILWNKDNAKEKLLSAYYGLGGKKLFNVD